MHDLVLGDVRFENDQLDDMVLLRSDGTPTYMLAVVVDDHDMGVTHVIRGADHLNNAARQLQIIEAMGWPVPVYGHLPLINGPDGAKLSKRHGALAVEAYRDMGYLPETMRNYLLRLGWSHGDDEIISTEQAIEWFNFEAIGKSAARMDYKKLDNLNGHYIRDTPDDGAGGRSSPPSWSRETPPRILSDDGAGAAAGGHAVPEGAGQDPGRTRSGCGISVHGRSPRPGRRRRQAADARGARRPGRNPARAGGDRLERPPRWKTPPAAFAEASGPEAGPGGAALARRTDRERPLRRPCSRCWRCSAGKNPLSD